VPFGAFDSQRALAIVLGAREFPKATSLELHGTRFSNSASAFRKYLIQQLGIPRRNVLDLFDDASSPDQILVKLKDFLDRRTEELKSTPLQDLLFYYVGHGFLEGRGISDLHLAIRETDIDGLSYTALDLRSLANLIRSRARFVRRYLILDCCYGAAASRAWSQADGPAGIAMRNALDLFPPESPTRGTAILSAAESDKEANALGKRELTAFSDGLLQCLEQGREELGERISLESLHGMLVEYLRTTYNSADSYVRPKVESPEASEGDVAWLPIFPNPAYARVQGIALQQHQEAERKQAETARQPREEVEHKQADPERQQREEADRRARESAAEERARVEYRGGRKKAMARLFAACCAFLVLGIASEVGTAYVVAGASSDWYYYFCAFGTGSIEGWIYAFALFDRLPVAPLHIYLLGGSYAFGWITMAHSEFDPLAGVLGGVCVFLSAFITQQWKH
jgi:hypothetical protein